MFYSLTDIANNLVAAQAAATPLLDKLETTLENTNQWTPLAVVKIGLNAANKDFQKQTTFEKNIRNRANSKHLTTTLAAALLQLKKPHNPKAYINTFACASFVVKEDDRLKSKYCKNRWCLVCNRIKTAYLINKYTPFISQWHDKHFVTLTAPNVKKAKLSAEIDNHLAVLLKIKDRLRKQGHKIVGIRKLETTYNPERNDYHPHFHLIVESRQHAQMILNYWLEYYPAASAAAQDIQPATDGTIKELFKYFTKITSDSKKSESITLPALDSIFEAVKGRRVFQSFGFVARDDEILTDEKMNELQKHFDNERAKTTNLKYSSAFTTQAPSGPTAPTLYGEKDKSLLKTNQVYIWNQNAGNWHDNGETLSNYELTGNAKTFKNKLKYETDNRIKKYKSNDKRDANTNARKPGIRAQMVERPPRPEKHFLFVESQHNV